MALSDSERNDFIMECLADGMSLSELQDQLIQRYDIHMTYMELRMLTAELQVNWTKQDAKAEAAKAKSPAASPRQAPPADVPADGMSGAGADAYGAREDGLPEEEPPVPAEGEPPAAEAPQGKEAVLRGKTTVEVSKVVRPGASLSGSVTFGSGAAGEWYVDAYGRLGLSLAEGSAKPDQQDVMEFQKELQKQLGY